MDFLPPTVSLGLKLIWELPVDVFQAEIASVKASLEKAKMVEGSAWFACGHAAWFLEVALGVSTWVSFPLKGFYTGIVGYETILAAVLVLSIGSR